MNKKSIYVIIFLVLLVAVGAFFIFHKKDESQNQPLATEIPTGTIQSTTEPIATSSASPKMNTDKLIIQDEVVGTGVEAVSGKSVTVNYTGTLTNGTVFDSNTDPKFGHVEPFTFNLGAGQVIQGWDQGVAGMKIGGKRKLTIPPSLGYGSQDQGPIPANSTLIFEVELLKVE
jgi:peptidylprolyl isomerase/FKBP-type peptidyl-prolyl cis-trans isomerase FkpA